MIVSLALAAAALPATVPLQLSGDTVRVGDVATVGTGGTLAILRLPPGRTGVTLSSATVSRLVANRLPGVPFTLRGRQPLRISRGDDSLRARADCAIARVAIAGGTPISGEVAARGRCDGQVPRLGYDRVRRLPVARDDIPAGTNLGPIRLAAAAPLAAGRTFMLRTQTGPVTIERQVVALQAGRPGARLFVMTKEGAVLSGRLAAAAR